MASGLRFGVTALFLAAAAGAFFLGAADDVPPARADAAYSCDHPPPATHLGGDHAENVDIVSCTRPNASTEVWRIDRPNVRARETEYPYVHFRAGDVVTIRADGCAQTGGLGRTWKKYLQPRGRDANRLYWGTLTIPGVTPPGERLSRWVDRQIQVTSAVPSNSVLHLGYLDEGYGDNGYWGHDDGDDDQCKSSNSNYGGPAWVTLTIQHGGHAGPEPPPMPMDLVWSESDGNGWPLNPLWGKQKSEGLSAYPDVKALCTSNGNADTSRCTRQQPTMNDYWLCHLKYNWYPGFASWSVASYTGAIRWGYKTLAGQDDDYNLFLIPDGQASLAAGSETKEGRKALQVEFDSDETIDHFGSTWWKNFKGLVDDDDNCPNGNTCDCKPGRAICNKPAVVVGLVAIDGAHTPQTEVHPAYAVAINANTSQDDDVWAFFVRNRGNQGYCSPDEFALDAQSVTIEFPHPGATSVALVAAGTQVMGNLPGMSFSEPSVVPGKGARVTFNLNRGPDDKPMMDGEIHFKWTGSAPRREPAVGALPATARALEGTERNLVEIARNLTPDQKRALAAKMPPKRAWVTAQRVAPSAGPRPMIAVAAAPHLVKPRLVQNLEKRKEQRDEAEALCTILADRTPSIPSFCAKVRAEPRVEPRPLLR
jgi:hypothetical protein